MANVYWVNIMLKKGQKIKVIFVLGYPNPSPDASWTRISFFAKKFLEKGYDVSVFGAFTPKSLSLAGFRQWEGIPIYNIIPSIQVYNGVVFILKTFLTTFLLPITFLIVKPKVVIISLPAGEPALGSFIASRLAHSKVVFDIRDEWEDYQLQKSSSIISKRTYEFVKMLMSALYIKADLVVTVTEKVAKSLKVRGVTKIKVVPNGADINVFRPYEKNITRKKLGLKAKDFIIVYEGGVGDYYRLDVVVKALAKLDNEIKDKIKLLIIGYGKISNILRLAEELVLSNNVIYLGKEYNKSRLAQIISSGDVGIIPYDNNPLWKNSLPAKFFEYIACGLPVIATAYNDSLLAQIINQHQIGLTVPPSNENELLNAILTLYFNPYSRELMGKRARRFIVDNFDRNKNTETFLKLVEECIKDV